MTDYNHIPSDHRLEKAVEALQQNGVSVTVVADKQAAVNKLLELVPEGSQVMTMTSTTLDQLGATAIFNESGKYQSVKQQLSTMNRETDHLEMQKLGAAPDYAVGSIHGLTEHGEIVVVSNTGSQLPAYAYGANHVVWVVGAQKLGHDLASVLERIEKHVLPLESERARKAYGVEGSNISKVLIINKEVNPNRLHLILVKEVLGF